MKVFCKDFANTKAQSMKKKDKMDFIKIKNACSAKDTVNRNKTQSKRWEKIFAKDTSDKGLSSKLCEELKLNDKKTNKSI